MTNDLIVAHPNQITGNDPVEALLEEWCGVLQRRVAAEEISETTATTYAIGAGKFIAWCKANAVEQIDNQTITEWRASTSYKPSTVNTWLAGIRAFFAWAAGARRIVHNPTQGVKPVKRQRAHLRDPLTTLEVKRVLSKVKTETVQGKRDYAILCLMAYTGVRQVEVHRANLEDLQTRGNYLVLRLQGKGRKERDDMVVLAHPNVQNAVLDWLSVRQYEPGALFTSLSNASKGERLSLRAIRDIVKGYYGAAGVVGGNKTTHSLRHTAITQARRGGATPEQVQNMARHSSITTTMIYIHEVDRVDNPAEAFIDYEE